MKNRLARFAVLSVGVLGLVAPTTSAEATTVKSITFTGTAFLTGGALGYPCMGLNGPDLRKCPSLSFTTKSGPKGFPSVNTTPGGNHADFNFTSFTCIKSSYSTPDKENQKLGIAEPCRMVAIGSVWGFCGLSTGQGFAIIDNLAGTKNDMNTISVAFKFTGVAGLLHVTGGNSTRWFVGDVSAVPVFTIGGPSCATKTANAFTFTGTATCIDKTPPLG